MARRTPAKSSAESEWTPVDDRPGRYSSGIPDFDGLLDGGFRQGSLALFELDEHVATEELDRLLAPTLLNFLHHSRGIIAVLPARDSPAGFRQRLLRHTSRRRFDSRVRVVDYVGESDPAPYVVDLTRATDPKRAKVLMARMAAAERAAQGVRGKSFLELNAFEILETIAGPETAARMYLHGIKRARAVSNLVIGLLRPGLKIAEAVRAMADVELSLSVEEVGLVLRGIQPRFPAHVVVVDRALGAPHVGFEPRA